MIITNHYDKSGKSTHFIEYMLGKIDKFREFRFELQWLRNLKDLGQTSTL
jgi:hypothetical protein